ncbi:hypothetical protein D1007_37429 [Hordeum vulgare]|nr:hypothetical protein D1007_37429 [Hordeum vulgare]
MNCNESMKVLQSELGFGNTEFTHSDLIKKLKLLVEIDREEENKKAVKIFFIIFFNKVVRGTTFPRYNRQAVMVKDMNYEDMAQMDFCQVIVETIQAGAIDWQKMKKGEKANKDHLYGLAQGPVIMYLDSLLLPNTREMNRIAKKMNNSSTPRANYLDEKDLKKIAKEDMKKDGKGRPDDYEFGKIKIWKGTEDRIFFMAHVNAGSPSTSLQVVPRESRRRGKQATKLLIDAPKLMHERASNIRTISEPGIRTNKESEEAFKRISKMLEQVLVEARQLPAVRQINLVGCSDDEANYDELARQVLADQTESLIATFEQHNVYQRMCCNRNLTPIAETVEEAPIAETVEEAPIAETVEEAPIRTREARNEVEEKLEERKEQEHKRRELKTEPKHIRSIQKTSDTRSAGMTTATTLGMSMHIRHQLPSVQIRGNSQGKAHPQAS